MKKITAVIGLIMLSGIPAIVSGASNTDTKEHELIGSTIGIDHVSLWAKDRREAEVRLEQLGFNLTAKPGSYGAGISNKLIWFENRSYVEFLWLSDSNRAQSEAPDEHAFASKLGGVKEYAFQVESATEAFATLTSEGLRGEVDGSENWDPDGPEGPKPAQPSMWRNVFLERGQLPGSPFFIQYNLPTDHVYPSSYHPNGAQQISSVWIIVEDLQKATKAYSKAKFSRSRKIELPALGLSGVALSAGFGEVFLFTPDRNSAFHTGLLRRGDHVAGFSVKVAALQDAITFVGTTSLPKVTHNAGPYGPWVIANTYDQLGVSIAFHE